MYVSHFFKREVEIQKPQRCVLHVDVSHAYGAVVLTGWVPGPSGVPPSAPPALSSLSACIISAWHVAITFKRACTSLPTNPSSAQRSSKHRFQHSHHLSS